MSFPKDVVKAVQAHIDIPEDIRRMISAANADLYSGDMSDEDYPGFEKVCRILSDWLADYSTLYVGEDSCCISDRYPEYESECETCEGSGHVWREVCSEHEGSCLCPCDNDLCDAFQEPLPFYAIERSDLARILFGSELAQCV